MPVLPIAIEALPSALLDRGKLPAMGRAFAVDRLRESRAGSGVVFDRQLRDRAWGPTGPREAITSTAIALIGLDRAGVRPAEVGMDPETTHGGMFDLARAGREPGPTGLILWANAVTGGPPAAEALRLSGGSIPEPRRLRTMELAWLVSGLAHEGRRSPTAANAQALGTAIAALIGRFEAPTRTFRHADADSPARLRARRWVATFADQVYPVQALALASIATGDARTLDVAAAAASRMVEVQGPSGQWWWHHDPRDGRVSSSYPVYSVHQHGMAPMAFRTLAKAGGPNLGRAAEAGRAWISANELGVDLADPEAGTIWRSIARDEGLARRLARHLREIIGHRDDRLGPGPSRNQLRVNHETRPYEWAWYLFAGAIEAGDSAPGHLA